MATEIKQQSEVMPQEAAELEQQLCIAEDMKQEREEILQKTGSASCTPSSDLPSEQTNVDPSLPETEPQTLKGFETAEESTLRRQSSRKRSSTIKFDPDDLPKPEAKRKSVGTSQPKKKAKTSAPAAHPSSGPENRGVLQKVADMLMVNKEPFNNNEWRRKPWPARPYQVLEKYEVAKDAGEGRDSALLLGKIRIKASDSPEVEQRSQGNAVDSCETISKQLDDHARCLHLEELPKPLQLGVDINEQDAWGMDCYSYKATTDALSLCPELQEATPEGALPPADSFVLEHLLPAVQRQGARGWDICKALQDIVANDPNDQAVAAARHLLFVIPRVEGFTQANGSLSKKPLVDNTKHSASPADFYYWRLHPKGQGVFAKRDIPKGTFVQEYLGELYAPWRWFEKQDLLRKTNPNRALPDFYNISLERPKDIPGGFDVVFVEAADRGNFASRLSHSCGPNCKNVAVVVGNARVTNALFTTRDIKAGTELCWDYACVTESEREYKSAICLCSSLACRGSFLYYANSSTFQEVMQKRHDFLDRNAILVRACAEDVTDSDQQLLQKHGIGESLLGENPPTWQVKWAALILEYIELERRMLPEALLKTGRYTEAAVELEADGVMDNRLQNLAITIDKVNFFLRHQPQHLRKEGPLKLLSEDETLSFLWRAPDSVWNRAVQAATNHFSCAKMPGHPQSLEKDQALNIITQLQEVSNPATIKEAREQLLKFEGHLRRCGPNSAGLADIVFMNAHTQTFFTSVKFENAKADTRCTLEVATADGTDTDAADPGSSKGKAGRSGKGKASSSTKKLTDVKRYNPSFLWGQCSAWYKQTIFDPTASLSAERRGALSIPDVETAYSAAGKGNYLGKQREVLLNTLAKSPGTLWPVSLPFSFRNSKKIYGSIMLDAALKHSRQSVATEATYGLDQDFVGLLSKLNGCYGDGV